MKQEVKTNGLYNLSSEKFSDADLKICNSLLSGFNDSKEKTIFILNLFDDGAEAYKDAQILINKIDAKIHNEFAYFSRAFVSVLRIFLDSDDSDDSKMDLDLTLSHGLGAVCHILNDSLDLIFGYASQESKRLSKICSYTGIKEVYPDYIDVRKIIKKFAPIISRSRKERGIKRIEEYIKLTKSEDYRVLIDFCLAIDDIADDLKRERRKELNGVKHSYFVTIAATVFGLVSSLIVGYITWKYFVPGGQ